jgi:cobalt-zinc-cadmium efflux system membrane fusion protein
MGINHKPNAWICGAFAAGLMLALGSCDNGHNHSHDEHAAEEFERGPHGGRMLRDGDVAMEITIFETNTPPEFRVYPYIDNKPADPKQVQLSIAVTRLGNKVDRFSFQPRSDYLQASASVTEPHSFDVAVSSAVGGKKSAWTYSSYEGRTTIAREAAEASGIKVEAAGPAVIEETVDLTGRIELLPEGRGDVRAWYPGRIVAMSKYIGDKVRKGEVIARVESASSLQTYSIPAPFDGVVAERHASVGGVTGDAPLYVIIDTTKLHAEFSVFPQDTAKVRAGQAVRVGSAAGGMSFEGTIEVVLPENGKNTPILIAHVPVPADGAAWYPGLGVTGVVTIGTQQVPLAVRTAALQRFRDFTVVYARVGDTYEVRMLTLGRQTPTWTEVTGGLAPGEIYVTDNAFLVRADVEKSGASHDH